MKENIKVRILNGTALSLNVIIVILTFYSIVGMTTGSIAGNMTAGVRAFRYFTNLSNILVAVFSTMLIPFNINGLISGKYEVPKWLGVCKFVGTTAVTITFVTVVFFLGPTMGWTMMFDGPCLYLHALIPILAIISLLFVEVDNPVSFKLSIFGLAPSVIYSIIYLFAVAITKVWPDFYGFTFGGKMWTIPLSMIMMYSATFVLSSALWALQNLFHKLYFLPKGERFVKKSKKTNNANGNETTNVDALDSHNKTDNGATDNTDLT